MIIDRLREATRNSHKELDHLVYPLVQQANTPQKYAQLLAVFYGFFKPVQDRIDSFLIEENVSHFSQRRRPVSLLNDIRHFFPDHPVPALCQSIPAIDTPPQAFGAYYVLEGSTLGGEIISKKIAGNLSGGQENGLTFFQGYGQHNREMWNDFLISLEHDSNFEEADGLVTAAEQTFITFKNWISETYERK